MTITLEIAKAKVLELLKELEAHQDQFGSALPENANRPKCSIIISTVEEHEFGWVFNYNSRNFLEEGDFSAQLVGHGPVLVRRSDGEIYECGSHEAGIPIQEILRAIGWI